jgi:enoyl-CoA hydratase
MSTTHEPPVLFHRRGHLGHIELNRPKAINALTLQMVHLIAAQLTAWADDDSVRQVLLTGAGERGLCAGGDIVAMYRDALAGGSDTAEFLHHEYNLNYQIHTYGKPFVAIMDGIVLGGGIGLSAHANIRVVTERSSIGMPETTIGFIPDVGGTHLLSHAPGELGTHLALTAGSVRAGDAIEIGMADWFIPTTDLPAVYAELETADAFDVVKSAAGDPPASDLATQRAWIDQAYSSDSPAEIVDRLASSDVEQARQAAATIASKSPTAVAVTLRALRESARFNDLRDALDLEFRVATRLHGHHDFAEGVRAQVVDKDRNPMWKPSTLAEVHDVSSYFEV